MVRLQVPAALLAVALALLLAPSTLAVLYSPPSNNAVCHGLRNSGPAGMNGYSVALSSGFGSNLTWMAVGKPWDCSVTIYTIANPDMTLVKKPDFTAVNKTDSGTGNSESIDDTANDVPVNVTQIPIGQWNPTQLIGDSGNGTYPSSAYSLFGYSVALSHSGTWLAVGIPGRSAARGLEGHTYKGAVRVYRRQENMTVFTYIGEIPNPNPSASTFLSFDKFGAKVEWRSVYDDASKQMKTFLFVAANSGWDGATPRYKEAPPNNVNWPLGPTTDVTRAGVYVYHLQQPNQPGLSASIVGDTASSTFRYLQHIKQKSTFPLGTVGIDFASIVIPDVDTAQAADSSTAADADPSATVGTMKLLVRDFTILPSQISKLNISFPELCPTNNCSYIDTTISGKTYKVNGTGVVVEYRLNSTGLFSETGQILSSLEYPFVEAAITVGSSVTITRNGNQAPSDWDRNDWFGAGIAVGVDVKYNRPLAAIGAPRDASGVYSYFADNKTETGDEWKHGQFILNDDNHRSSVFGQRIAFSPDGRFLVVADPMGTSGSMGRGTVGLYYRRSSLEVLVPREYNTVAKPRVSNTTSVPFVFDKLALLGKTPTPVLNHLSFEGDHYGVGLAVNRYFIVVGAPLDQCVSTFVLPMAFEEEVTGSTKLSPPGNSQPTGKNDILMYALIGAGAGVLLIMPTVFLLARHQHRKRVIRTLKAMAAATGSQAVLVGNNTLIAAPGMAGLPGMNTVGIRSAKGKRANVYDAGPGVSESQTGLTQLPNAVTMSTGSLGGSQTVLARARTGTNASNLSGTSNTKFRRRSRTTLRDSTTPDLQALPTEKLSRKQ